MEQEIPFGTFQPGKRAYLIDFPLFPGIFQWDEPTKRFPLTAEPKFPEILTKCKVPTISDDLSRTDPRSRTLHSPQVSLTRQKLRWWPLVKGLCTLPKFLSLCKATLIYPFALSFDLGFLFPRVI